MSEVIVITSGKGGVGKTTTTANVGTGLAQLNKKVVMIDTDIGLRNLDVVMGLENRIVYNLVDVIEGKCRLKQALIKDKKYPELCLLPSAQTRDKDDEHIVVSTNQGEPLVGSDCLAGKAYANISRRITGEDVPFLDLEVKQGVFGKLMDLFKKN